MSSDEQQPTSQSHNQQGGNEHHDYGAAFQARLVEAVRVLTDAARLPRPRLRRTEDGAWIEDTSAAPEQTDWAEFVSLALAGAAANVGGIEAILAGRSGSWEAEGVRQLLLSTVGADEAALWSHRTEPIEITLYVGELLEERTGVVRAYEEAQEEIDRRAQEVSDRVGDLDEDQYVWSYDYERGVAGADGGEGATGVRLTARQPDAPAWSWDAWRAQPWRDQEHELIASMEESLRRGAGLWADTRALTVFKSRAAAEELWRLEDERDAELEVFGDLEERLEAQRIREWTTYGEALQERVERLAAGTPGLTVPVRVVVDADWYRLPQRPAEYWNSLETRLIDAAVLDTPTPEDGLSGHAADPGDARRHTTDPS